MKPLLTAAHRCSPLLTAAYLLCLHTSCTVGHTVDATTGNGVNGVALRFDAWPPPEVAISQSSTWSWPTEVFPNIWLYPPDHDTSTFTGLVSGTYGFEEELSDCVSGVESEYFSPIDGWYRIKGTKSGYRHFITYQYHDYDQTCMVPDCDTGELYPVPCEIWPEFALEPVNVSQQAKPDMIIDIRDLRDAYVECGYLYSNPDPSFNQSPEIIAIRASIGSANVGCSQDLGVGEVAQRRILPSRVVLS